MLTATADQILTKLMIARAGGEARRLVSQGAVKINGDQVLRNVEYTVYAGDVIKVGRHKTFVVVSTG